MYWIALALFAVGVLTPEVVRHGYGAFHEEEVEFALLLLINGGLFFIYLWTDRARRAVVADTRACVQEAHDVGRDLSKAYNHIGEMNRKVDIVAQVAAALARPAAHRDRPAHLCAQLRDGVGRITRRTCHAYALDARRQRTLATSPGAPVLSRAQVRSLLAKKRRARIVHEDGGQHFSVIAVTAVDDTLLAIVAEGSERHSDAEALVGIMMACAAGALRRSGDRAP